MSLRNNSGVFDKVIFGLAHQPDILAAVERTGRKTTVLIGLETDVCVMHSAIGLLGQGYRVAVVADATDTPAPGQEIGLKRMQSAGAIIVNMKGLFYEWLRTIENVNRFHRELPDMRDLSGNILYTPPNMRIRRTALHCACGQNPLGQYTGCDIDRLEGGTT